MKQILILIISISLFNTTNAQIKYPEKILKISGGLDSKSSETLAINGPNSKFLFDNGRGKVYESLIDKMRFLAPDFQSNMPILVPNFESKMPVQKMAPGGLIITQSQGTTPMYLPKLPTRP
jgi:hypothetical protein